MITTNLYNNPAASICRCITQGCFVDVDSDDNIICHAAILIPNTFELDLSQKILVRLLYIYKNQCFFFTFFLWKFVYHNQTNIFLTCGLQLKCLILSVKILML